jgi:hypothetical protein
MKQGLVRLTLALAILAMVSPMSFAQGGATSSITGVVLDSDGGAVPGATIVATNNATNESYTAVSGGNGSFTIPAIGIGTYTVTVTLSGFKTAIISNVALTAGGPADIRATLEVGGVAETVTVEGKTVLVQTQATSVSTTVDINQVQNLPLVSRNALDFITFLPGVNTPGGNRNSTVNGLPQSTINITVDGMNVQDNYLKTTDGFFARMSPRLDAVEEATVTSAAQGADAAGQGAIQIRFVTRSGSNTFSGSAYWYFRADELNSKDWFTDRDGLPKTELLQNQPGFRVGGPIVIPGLYDGRGKAFYFVNYEEFRQPQTVRRQRTILTAQAQQGLFSYTTSSGMQTVNLMALAAANGQISTFDPTVAQLLADIRSAASSTGLIEPLSDPSLERFTWNVDQRGRTKYPTGKVDYNFTGNHRLTFSINYNGLLSDPDTLNGRDPQFPGFPVQGTQDSHRYTTSGTLRSTFGGTMVNEFRIGATGGPTYFAPGINPSMWSGSVANEGGFKLGISTANISNPSSGSAISSREGSTWVVENTVNWQKGSHSLNLGGSLTMGRVWLRNQTQVPSITFDVSTNDPAKAMFTSAAFPGASSTQRGDAEDLYAVLVGRVTAISGEARIDPNTNRYVYLGQSLQEGRLPDWGFWIQDAWRPRPDLTINVGLRYELQQPFYAVNDSYSTTTLEDVWGISGYNASTCTDMSNITTSGCNLFQPGNLPGKAETQYYQLNKGVKAYNTDYNNFAPSVGVAWTPTAETGWLARFLGSPGDTVFRAGFARSFSRPGMSDFTGRLDDNPGLIITANRNESLGNLGTLPVLFRDRDRLGPPAFDEERNYPMTDVVTEDVQIFDPNLQVPYADTWTAGWQRAVSRNMAVEVRYVGTRSRDLWTTYNINEVNIHENGFFEEFKLAQANLVANVAAGRGSNFRYYGPGTGTSPLPIYLAYFSGRTDATNAAAYSSSNFASSTFYNPLAQNNPNPFGAADNLDADSTRRANALAAGLAPNFLVANPNKLGGAEIDGHGGYTNFNGMQVELRRRMAQGFQFQASYSYGKSYGSSRYSFRVPRVETRNTGGEGDVTHALKGTWVWELPFGQGRRYGGNVSTAMDRLVGGWQVHGTARFQSGRMVDFGNIRMVGFDAKGLQDMYKVRIDSDGRVWMLPQDVIDNTVRAFSVDATSLTGYGSLGAPSGKYFAPTSGPDCIETISNSYGDCGARSIVITGPMFKNVDISVVKAVPIVGRVRAEFRVEMLNAFNFVNYVPVTGIGTNPDDYEVTGLNGAVTARILQIVSRVTW